MDNSYFIFIMFTQRLNISLKPAIHYLIEYNNNAYFNFETINYIKKVDIPAAS